MTLSRRDFLRGTALVGTTLGAGGAMSGCGNQVDPAPLVDGQVSDTGQVLIDLRRFPDLEPIGGAITVRLRSRPATLAAAFRVPDAVLLVHRGAPADPPEFVAMDAACPHAGCPLGYSAEDQLVECPCHGSRFRATIDPAVKNSCVGDVVHRPAIQGPTPYQVTFDPGSKIVLIDLTAAGCQQLPAVMNGKVTLTVTENPQLGVVGGSVVGTPKGFSDPIVVVRVDSASVVALNARCTHLGCTVAYVDVNRDLECPCHNSSYDLNGKVTAAPSTSDLAKYAATFDGETVIVSLY